MSRLPHVRRGIAGRCSSDAHGRTTPHSLPSLPAVLDIRRMIVSNPILARRRRHHPRRTGFTLIEAALTTAIIGFGVVSMMGLLATGTTNNKDSAQLTTGLQFARAMRE